MAIISVGSTTNNLTALPDPKMHGFKVDLQDIDSGSTTRTANGTMIRDRVVGAANAKRKLFIEWPPLDPINARNVLQAISDVFFYVKYPDPYTGEFRTAQFYAGDRSVPLYSAGSDGQAIFWEGISVNLIEK